LDEFGWIWAKQGKIWAKVIRFRQNLAFPNTFDLIWLWTSQYRRVQWKSWFHHV